jgi:indolepyruvate ferredoxin oxidoreductase beta subunit
VESKTTTDILIVGVGGQGIILASEILGYVSLCAGYDVKQSEVHGMAQRGGSVTSHVRFGQKVYSPTIEEGRGDFLVSFEMLEALRWIDCLAPGGTVIVNTQEIPPITVTSGAAEYPQDIRKTMGERCGHVVFIDGANIAREAGNARTVNAALLGALAVHLEFDTELWAKGIRDRVPRGTFEVNWAAFQGGRDAGGAVEVV